MKPEQKKQYLQEARENLSSDKIERLISFQHRNREAVDKMRESIEEIENVIEETGTGDTIMEIQPLTKEEAQEMACELDTPLERVHEMFNCYKDHKYAISEDLLLITDDNKVKPEEFSIICNTLDIVPPIEIRELIALKKEFLRQISIMTLKMKSFEEDLKNDLWNIKNLDRLDDLILKGEADEKKIKKPDDEEKSIGIPFSEAS